ncbi:unnamed protein product [Rotaria sordida]|uniref:Uncharacterized protein n=1 Tax=Rotaria sordida TaxID=392033 RepID=A0A819SIF7_9BILA|nr:unnamed protein product [Rotaria sordida]
MEHNYFLPIPKNPSVRPPTQKPTKFTTSNKKSATAQFNLSSEFEVHQENGGNNDNILIDVGNCSSFSTTNSNKKNKTQTMFDGTFDASITITDENENGIDIYLDRINQLSLKVQQQAQLLKQRDAEIKRLQSTMIEIPTDQATQDYICHMGDKIRQNTKEHIYVGNLTDDARLLGINVQQLKEILNMEDAITSIAREIFKKMIPEHKRTVKHWNDLPEDIILKEKLLIQFLERYYGPLKVVSKKVHISLVGCLRNDRGKQKKMQQQVEMIANNDEHNDHLEKNY